MFIPYIAVAAIASIQTLPLSLKFEPNESLRYKESLESTGTMSFAGQVETVRMVGSRVTKLDVTTVVDGLATMKVSFEGITANATILKTPAQISASDKAKAEKGLAEQLRNELSLGERTQTVNARGIAEYRFAAGDNRYVLIEKGAFLMVALPETSPMMGENWYIKIMQADPSPNPPIEINYKLVGASMIGQEKAYKIALFGTKSDSQTDERGKSEMNMVIKGNVNVGTISGKVLSGEVTTDVTQKLSAKGQTQTQIRKTVQKFEKI